MKQLHDKIIDLYRLATVPVRYFSHRHAVLNGTVPVIVLFYHRVADCNLNPWTMTREDFDRHISWLSRNFDLVSLDEAQRRIRSRNNSRPTVSITFDDGYSENCNHAIPILIKRRIPATYFVTLENVVTGKPFAHDAKRKCPLTPNNIESLQAISAGGIEIGAHTRTHANLGELTDSFQLADEVINSAEELQTLVGQRIRYFAFPFGQFKNLNQHVFELAYQHGFEGVCSAYGGYNEIGDDEFHLQRIHGDPSLSRLKNWLTYDPRIKRGKWYEFDRSKLKAQKENPNRQLVRVGQHS